MVTCIPLTMIIAILMRKQKEEDYEIIVTR
jgi:hypothetical protein